MAGGKKMNPRLDAAIVIAVVLVAAVVSAFIKSKVSGQPFSLNWGMTICAALACAVISYLGPPLLHHFFGGRRAKGKDE